MMCRRPFISGGNAFGCGQCDPCRMNRRRVWSHRCMLESKLQPDNCMITLTYDDENLPLLPDGRGNLVPKHLQDFLKRFRARISPRLIRFYGCGEYGDDSDRPHFHLCMFNYPNCVYGKSRYFDFRLKSCCVNCDLVRDAWGLGGVFLCELNDNTAQYVAQYVTKKMTDKGHPKLLGRHPEFPRMSKGLGKKFMWEVASELLKFNLMDRMDDVPSSLRSNGRLLPLGRYLTSELRGMVGRDKKTPQAKMDEIAKEMRPLFENSIKNETSFKKEVMKAADQAVLNMETRQKIFRQRKDKL